MYLPNLTLMLNRLNLLNFKLFTQKVDLKEFHVTSYNPIGFNLESRSKWHLYQSKKPSLC